MRIRRQTTIKEFVKYGLWETNQVKWKSVTVWDQFQHHVGFNGRASRTDLTAELTITVHRHISCVWMDNRREEKEKIKPFLKTSHRKSVAMLQYVWNVHMLYILYLFIINMVWDWNWTKQKIVYFFLIVQLLLLIVLQALWTI